MAIHGVLTERGNRDLGRYGGLLFLCVLVAAPAGCRNEASQVKSPDVVPAGGSLVREPAEAQVPQELKVTVLLPEIGVEEPVLDLGEVGLGAKRTGQFKFTSTGSIALKILKVQSCCGVATRGVEAGREYAPGQSGVLEFDFFGNVLSPAITRELVLETNDPDHKLVKLTMKASVVRRVECSPIQLRLFPRKENAGCEDITIRSLDGRPFSISSFKSTAEIISVPFDPNAQATEFVLRPRVNMEKVQRYPRGQISIDLTHPECVNMRMPFDVLTEFTVNPAVLMWLPGQPKQREIVVISNYSDDFEVESVSSQKGYIKLLDKTKVGDRYQLQVEIALPARQGTDTTAADMIEVKIKDAKPVSIPFRGFYEGS